MARMSVVALVSILATAQSAVGQINWGDKPIIGFVQTQPTLRYTLFNFRFGLEQWEDGKKSNRYQQWSLWCDFDDPMRHPARAECRLERTSFELRWIGLIGDADGVIVGRDVRATADGTLRISRVDWNTGTLDFEILDPGGTVPVFLKLRIKDDTIYLEHFRALSTGRGVFSDEITTMEWKIPEYSYVLPIPLGLRGLRTEKDKRWDDLIRQLSPADQAAWERARLGDRRTGLGLSPAQQQEIDALTEKAIAQENDPAFQARVQQNAELADQDRERLTRIVASVLERFHSTMLGNFNVYLEKHGMSATGRRRIDEFLLTAWLEERHQTSRPRP